MNLTLILKNTAEELFWLGFAFVLAWYSAATWPISNLLSVGKFTLLYAPFAITAVFLLKEFFFRYSRIFQLLILTSALALSIVSIFLLYIDYTRQFSLKQLPVLSEAIKANNHMDIWELSTKQPDALPYFLVATILLTLFLLISALRAGFIIPRNR